MSSNVKMVRVPPYTGAEPLVGRYYMAECERCGWLGSSSELTDDCQCTREEGGAYCLGHTMEVEPERLFEIIQAMAGELASANADKAAYAQNAIDLRESLTELNGIERKRDTAFALLRRCLMAVREQRCDDNDAEFDLPAPLMVDIDSILSASAEPSAVVERDDRAEFEAAYCEYFNALPGVNAPITPEQMRAARTGDTYGEGSNGKNLRWAGWQMRAGVEVTP